MRGEPGVLRGSQLLHEYTHRPWVIALAILPDELDVELGQFDTEFLVDFISKKFGAVYYNKGIEDAQKVMERKMLDISDELYEIEQIVEI